MTDEVIEEADEHHVFYELVGNGISYDSTSGDTLDSNGNALNLVTKWTTTTATVVDVEAYLIHQPTSKVQETHVMILVELQMLKLNLKLTLSKILNNQHFNYNLNHFIAHSIIYFNVCGL